MATSDLDPAPMDPGNQELDASPDTELARPFREIDWEEDPEVLHRFIRSMDLSVPSTPSLNILLFGAVGSGKSSLHNTLKSSVIGRVCREAVVRAHGRSVTRTLRQYAPLGQEAPVRLFDSMGVSGEGDYRGALLASILGGHVPVWRELVDPIDADTPGWNHRPDTRDRMHCLVLVVAALDVSNDELMSHIVSLVEENAVRRVKPIPVMVFITKVDEFERSLQVDYEQAAEDDLHPVSKVFRSRRVKALVDEVARATGLNPNQVWPVVNLRTQVEPVREISLLMLNALIQVMYAAEDGLREQIGGENPERVSTR